MELVVATRNGHKLAELCRLLPEHTLRPLPETVKLPPEEGESYDQNALAKARAAAAALRLPALGEDSGIEAQALGGAPGIRSARYAGEAGRNASDELNNQKLLAEAPAGSRLRYVCALALVDPGCASEHVFWGTCDGRLAPAPRGGGGFGYDPIFLPDAEGGRHTMAELDPARKDEISHRGSAARALRSYLAAKGG